MENKKTDNKLTIKEILTTVAIGIVIAIFSFQIIRVSHVTGNSMDTTLFDGEKIIIYKLAYEHSLPERGDIVVFEAFIKDNYLIKRVIGLPGDTIEIKDNILYVNGEIKNETYIKEKMYTENYPLTTIPKGKLFVLGDNRNKSTDSRNFTVGLVDIETELVGKAVFSISEFKTL